MKFKILAYLSWVAATLATIGSLYFSEVLRLPPCVLCWYQRILMYPLVFIITVGILRRDKGLPVYVLPLSVLGLLVAFYHTLLQWGTIPEVSAPCLLGVSCTTRFIEWFGFVTIPFLSFLAFGAITGCMVMLWKLKR